MPGDILSQLRTQAIGHSLFRPTTLKSAIDSLGFVQADPIRSPAVAQDLILRHRVEDYRARALEVSYPGLDMEEDTLYAYGFLARPVWRALHPKRTTSLPALERKILVLVRRSGPMHPKKLEAHFGGTRIVNAWGGYSKATKWALECLHERGLLRVSGREKGIRIYEAAVPWANSMEANDRFRKLALAVANVLAPVSMKTLETITTSLGRQVPGITDHRMLLRGMLKTGEIESRCVDGITYVWPASGIVHEPPPRHVRFLAPFDPLVWDRGRFEHFWGWPYRFEAYTPRAKRVRGYYAMPLLWGERIIGWANASVLDGNLTVDLGFVEGRPTSREFRIETEAEIARLRSFLETKESAEEMRMCPEHCAQEQQG